jgi:hypothetical protein
MPRPPAIERMTPVRRLALLVAVLALAGTAAAAPLPGVRTPTGNIRCFYVPIKPTTHGTLLCDLKRASFAHVAQAKCMARAGLDWHGFALPWNRSGDLSCSGGILYDVGRDTPSVRVLAYGRTWRYRGFACTSRRTGLTCVNGHGHGLILSRAEWRAW